MRSMGGSLQEVGHAVPATPHEDAGAEAQAEVFVPDLLDATPTLRIHAERTKLAVALAFAAGGSGGLFGDALDRATVPASTWEASSFAKDLFLQTLVTHCFKARIGAEQPVMATAHRRGDITNPITPLLVPALIRRASLCARLMSRVQMLEDRP